MPSTESEKYKHIKPGDKVAITIVTTVKTVNQYSAKGQEFTAVEYESGGQVWTAELPHHPDEGTHTFLAHTTSNN